MRQLFKIHHHKHTGRLIHHRHTSYGALFVLIVVVGVLLFFTDRVVKADEMLVTATVQAPIPIGAPVFTAPDEGTITSHATVDFEGTCPIITPSVVVALYDETLLIGSGACENDGTFHITATVQEGLRAIIARVITVTDGTGQSSTPLHITYRPLSPPPTAVPYVPTNPLHDDASSTPSNATLLPLDIMSERPFLTFGAGQTARSEWRGSFMGGASPYTVTVDWGDGEKQVFKHVTNEPQSYPHIYSNKNHTYTVGVTVTDQNGQSLTRYYIAVNLAQTKPEALNILRLLDGDTPQSPLSSLYVLYASLFVMVLVLWRYEYTHHRRVVGIPIHYQWQKSYHRGHKHHQGI
jgi:hypothetical protein